MAGERRIAAAWLAAGEAAIVVEVVGASGSVPRGAGTRMVVGRSAVAGTIGGGHLELKAIAHARGRLAAHAAGMTCAMHAAASAATAEGSGESDAAMLDELHFPLGPALGQCCGGAVTLRFSPLDAAMLAGWPEPAPRFHLQLHGAGHVGRAIVRALAPLDDIAIDWIDGREDEFPAALPGVFAAASVNTGDMRTGASAGMAARPTQLRKVCTDSPEDEVADAPPGAFYLVLTHRHDLDLRIVEAVLRRGDFGFLGLIGSRTKKQRFIHQLQRRGIAPSAIDRMTCPIGIAGIDGKEPEVIAIAVAAQLLQAATTTTTAAGLVSRG